MHKVADNPSAFENPRTRRKRTAGRTSWMYPSVEVRYQRSWVRSLAKWAGLKSIVVVDMAT
eukprot:4968047-Pyramimonas_sp.AAC.1